MSPMRSPVILAMGVAALLASTTHGGASNATRSAPEQDPRPRVNDVVAFVGGESVVQQGESGFFESLLAAKCASKGVRLRNLAWEGDTVFEQPRDTSFPGLVEQLGRVKATLVFAQFGRAESLDGQAKLPVFVAAYGRLCDRLAGAGRRVVLVTPAPFEKPRNPRLPDLSRRNDDLAAYAAATVELAKRRGYGCADVFSAMVIRLGGDEPPLTDDGQRLSRHGLAVEASMTARLLGYDFGIYDAPGDQRGWDQPGMEFVREAVVARNRLWFAYARPTNWAFLGGDRQSVPSSRDPDDLKVRIFPRELEKFVPLIEKADAEVERLAAEMELAE
jgi:hypothetical protein